MSRNEQFDFLEKSLKNSFDIEIFLLILTKTNT